MSRISGQITCARLVFEESVSSLPLRRSSHRSSLVSGPQGRRATRPLSRGSFHRLLSRPSTGPTGHHPSTLDLMSPPGQHERRYLRLYFTGSHANSRDVFFTTSTPAPVLLPVMSDSRRVFLVPHGVGGSSSPPSSPYVLNWDSSFVGVVGTPTPESRTSHHRQGLRRDSPGTFPFRLGEVSQSSSHSGREVPSVETPAVHDPGASLGPGVVPVGTRDSISS